MTSVVANNDTDVAVAGVVVAVVVRVVVRVVSPATRPAIVSHSPETAPTRETAPVGEALR